MAKTKSFLRREEYKQLAKLRIDGKILDIGGSKKSGYHELIQGDHTFVVGNIDESYGIDIVFDAQKPWPMDDASFDAVLLINLLEHLYDYRAALNESFRTLRQGGTVISVTPFMFNVHGSPNDYYRYTRSALDSMYKDARFSSVEIHELGTGAFSVIYHCLIGFVRWNWLASLVIPCFAAADRFLAWIKPNNLLGPKQYPLGFYVKATKA